jgi:hypothetical protein
MFGIFIPPDHAAGPTGPRRAVSGAESPRAANARCGDLPLIFISENATVRP